MDPRVDAFIQKAVKWQEELSLMRSFLLECGLREEIKWGSPCYTWQGVNIAGIRGFKEHCALWFFKGVLLKDEASLLISSGEETQAMRQIRFTDSERIVKLTPALKSYVFEAIEAEKAGLKVEYRNTADFDIPVEFQQKLDTFPELKKAFTGLTPGRQRDYIRHFADAKQLKTRESRIEKCIPQILEGKGLNDKYIC